MSSTGNRGERGSMSKRKETFFMKNRLDKDLKRIVDQSQADCEITEHLKIFCMCGIIQELREIHRTKADLERSKT